MSPANGHANDSANIPTTAVQQIAPPTGDTNIPTVLTPIAATIKELIASLEVPFHPSVIEWRVTNTSKGVSPRGQVMPYADQRAYTDRLNTLVPRIDTARHLRLIPGNKAGRTCAFQFTL